MYFGGQFGGRVAISEVEIYDPVARNVISVGQMQDRRAFFVMHLLSHDSAEGRVLVAGGENVDTMLSGAEICDIETFTWKRVTSMQVAVSRNKIFQLFNPVDESPYRFIVPSGLLTGSVNAFTSSQYYQTDG
jgi:hypothetical protein